MRKPVSKVTAKSAGKLRKLPLNDDPRWLPIQKVVAKLSARTGNAAIAAFEAYQALLAGRVRAMRRRLIRRRTIAYVPGVSVGPASVPPPAPRTIGHVSLLDTPDRHQREVLSREFWKDARVTADSTRLKISAAQSRCLFVSAVQIYLWGPDVEKAWPHLTRLHDRAVGREKETRPTRKRKRGTGRVGTPPTYDIPAIRVVIEHRIQTYGLEAKQAWFAEKIFDDLATAHIKAPGPERMRKLIAGYYSDKRIKRGAAKRVDGKSRR